MRLILKGMLLAATCSVLLPIAGAAFADPVTIHFLTAEKPETFAPAIAGFEKLHPDIKVDFQTVPFDSMNATIEARVGGKDPGLDVFLVDTPRVPAMADRGYLQNLNDDLDKVKAVTTTEAQGLLEYLSLIHI